MRWLWFLFSFACFAIAFRTHSMGLAALCLLVGLGLLLMGTLALASRRIESRGRDATAMMSPAEMRQMRERIERRKAEEGGSAGAAPAPAPSAANDNDSVPG
jgi:hypothetical protein